jgi:hypothetical protein
MYPSVRQFMTIADKNLLKNNPVKRADIQAAEDIFGTNLGALKVKTARRKGNPIDGQIHSSHRLFATNTKQSPYAWTLCLSTKWLFL